MLRDMLAQQFTDLNAAGDRELALIDRNAATWRDHITLSQAYIALAQQHARLAAAYANQSQQLAQSTFTLQHPSNVARARAERYAVVTSIDGSKVTASALRLTESDGGLTWRAPPPTGFVEEQEVESENEGEGERTL